jgi:hypothetical protein
MFAIRIHKFVSRCGLIFKDSEGNTVIWQVPNIPLAGWMVFKLLSVLVESPSIKSGFENLSTAFLFTWAYLEIVSGKSYFRRALGVVVMTAIVSSYFKVIDRAN